MPYNYLAPKKFLAYNMSRCTRDQLPKSIGTDGLIAVKEGYSIKELSWMFGVTWCTMQKWLQRRYLPSIRMLGDTHQQRIYRVHHRALMKFIAANPDYEYVLDRLQGNLDQFEPTTLQQKNQELHNAVARAPRERFDSIHSNRHKAPEEVRTTLRRADKRWDDNWREDDWPW